ncbi:DUF4407 domain-containing protein [Psychroflexus planctonicus]|uniref:DUF4407 domain-containing protein n=1 Tax=Psychroflexus planctonicus TaxID=1526575 RepID=A0ABQ1SKD3_9FLAO|nr:DUF4407 domain-containing protein [Psychroflexus planctonicus]GGE40928.1 hypothetical protein GCM10010832_21260 [Psychroflexus planctonicus]
MSVFKNFLLFSSGVTVDLIKQCPRFEVNKYMSIGMTIVFTTILSILSSYFAFYLIFDSETIAIPLSFLWGAIIFNLDRYIISSMRMGNSKWQQFLKSIPRILVAVIIATVISKPLELKIFDLEINNFLNQQKADLAYNIEKKYDAELIDIEEKKHNFRTEYKNMLSLRDKYYEEYKCECNGTCGTNVKGYGQECNDRKKRYNVYVADLEEEKKRMDSTINLLSKRELEIKDLIINEKKLTIPQRYGFIDKLKALKNIDRMSSIFIFSLFIFIETAPLLTKLLSDKGPYDNLILQHEIKFESEYRKKLDIYNNERLKNKRINDLESDLEIKSKETAMRNLIKNEAYEQYNKMRELIDAKDYKTNGN